MRASDGANWTDPVRTAVVTVGSGHPEITSTPPGLREDGVFHYQVTAVDPDGDKRLRYKVEKGPDGMVIDDITGELIWRPKSSEPGVHPVIVVVRDSSGLETKQSFSVTIQRQEVAAPAAPEKKSGRVKRQRVGAPPGWRVTRHASLCAHAEGPWRAWISRSTRRASTSASS